MFADEPVALITKSRGNSKYKIYSESKFRSNAQVNTPIFHRNGIKTKARSFSKIVYLDDRSSVSLYSKTEVTINGIIDNIKFTKYNCYNGVYDFKYDRCTFITLP